MLDQHLAGRNVRGRRLICERTIGSEFRCQLAAVYAHIDVSAARHLKFLKAGNRTHPGHNLFRNFARGLAQFPRKFKSNRQRVLAKFDFRRLLDDDVRDFQGVTKAQKLAQMLDQPTFQISIQEFPLTD